MKRLDSDPCAPHGPEGRFFRHLAGHSQCYATIGSCEAACVDPRICPARDAVRSWGLVGIFPPEEPSLMCVRGAQQKFGGVC